MGLIDYWHIARRRWLLIAGAVLLALLAATGYARNQPTSYVAASSMYVSMATGTSVNDSYQGGLAAQQRVRSYVDLANSALVAKRTVDDLSLKNVTVEELRGKITAFSPPATTLIIISVKDSSAERARDIANTVVAQFRQMIAELETIQQDAAPAARVAVVDRAELPGPIGPQTTRILALGLLAGLLIGALAAFVRDRTDRKLRTSNDLEAVLPVPILGIIDLGRPGAADETRRLRTRLQRNGEAATVLLTSMSQRSEPEIAMALAKSFADTGRHVVLIDADTTGHGGSRELGDNGPGLAAVLRGSLPVSEALTGWPQAGVTLLPLGAADEQTSDLLASDRFPSVVAKLRTDYDHVLIQAAPVAHAADAIALAPICEQTIAVVELGTSTAPQIRGALATFGDNPLTGAVAYSKLGNGVRRLVGRLRV